MDPPQLRVLLVEDDPEDALLLRDTLSDTPLPQIEWTDVEMLEAAERLVQRESFDLALLDLTLPDSRGIDTFLRLNAACPDLPVVLLTGLDDERVGLQAVQKGAEDYLVKGKVDGQVLARSFRYAVERSRRRRAERELNARQGEVLAAREIQQRLFPPHPPTIDGYDIAGASYPAVETGGDYFDYIPMSEGRVGIAIGDVCSHGLGPALVMAETRAYLRALMLTRNDVSEVLQLANRALSSDTTDECFVTLMLTCLDPSSGSLVYASAGHTPGYVIDDSGLIRRELWSTGLPLSIEPEGTFGTAQPLFLEKGDVVVLLTDGMIEACKPDGTLFGVDRVLQTVRANRHLPAAQIVQALYEAVSGFQGRVAKDDVTAVVIKVTDPPNARPPQ